MPRASKANRAASTAIDSNPGPRVPRREVWVDLPDEYPGFQVKLWVNYPRRLNDDLGSGVDARILAALQQVVVEHNGWCDADGTPFPSVNSTHFWSVIPDELAATLIVLLMQQVGKLAASVSGERLAG